MAYVAGTNGSEALNGTYGADYINALGGNDIIYGGYGSDNLDGGDGDDTFLVRGSEGPDFYTGGSGFDIIAVRNPDPAFSFIDLGISTLDSVEAIVNESSATVNIKTDYILDLSETTLVNINSIQGSEGNNYLTGNVIYNNALTEYRGIAIYGYGGNDEIIGSVAGDRLDGGNGNDTLIGGEGDDTLIGGAGADYFRFDANGGIDTVTDFVSGSDKIQLGPSITSVNLYNYNGNALLEFNGSSYAILSGVSPSAISSSDLVFA
ncbi:MULTISPECIES: calcium-binding protein [Methylobacterium]|uniref:calcium-binding protein n=1 Tax=Methylobacterium TaxID=407 RepID=UPI0013EBFC38|nr:hypothetical protein [Methylobacterium sp. DB0501]NGM39046.1 hypothetical protein [Methylobacterium sp. DB0501]